jgi:hypothetical protein
VMACRLDAFSSGLFMDAEVLRDVASVAHG